jgi:hypothetical protein
MSAVLTLGSRVTCSNQGTVTLSSSAKLTVQGEAVLLLASVAGQSIAGCTHPVDPNTSNALCTAVASVTGTPSSVLTAGGAGVLVGVSGMGNSTPPPPDTLSASAGQSLLTAGA